MRAAPQDTPMARLAEEHERAQHHTMVSSMVTWNDMNAVTAACAPIYGRGAELIAYELSQGYENETVAADRELYRIAQLLREELASDDPAGAIAARRAGDSKAPCFAALDAFLSTYGWRAETWSIDAPTWCELGDGFWAQLRQLARDDAVNPDDALERAAQRRRALIDDIDAQLAGDPDNQARFRRRVQRLAGYVPVREDRALWQLIATGSLRHAVLCRGDLLAERGLIDMPDDVLFALPGEVDHPPADLRDRVRARRAEHERWRAVRPPLFVGGPAASPAAAPGPVLKGVPGSRGFAAGVARVILDLADAGRVEPGDVLVCTMTAPPWTPLFAIAAAVVTESGELGSHPAIAAREYGIPCVVGATGATKAIPDGAPVEVDGTAGTVTIRAY
jgi:pyruvate,water dikinase